MNSHYEEDSMPRPRVPHRRDLILDAARALFHEKGWTRTTVSDIATHAMIGKGAVYLEFENKAAILDGLIRESSRRLIAQVRSRVLQADGIVDLAQVYRFSVAELLTIHSCVPSISAMPRYLAITWPTLRTHAIAGGSIGSMNTCATCKMLV
jgi:AcrR family transcriptional regulator